ncbi:MAG: hypothetical protein L3J28_11715 [Candidatus Polarisedimenticolaceae bacterium]|nr:hypothetical protein [Candidatus Polarisedimenticolaceae bacterium]
MSSQPEKGSVIFYDSCPPPLKADTYRLEVEQTLVEPATLANGDDGYESIDKTSSKKLPEIQKSVFEITGPQFLLPVDEIHSVYPPANGDGPFETRLPCVVLKRRTLPWERTASESSDSTQPWLALMLFSEDEVTLLDPPSCTVESILMHKPTSLSSVVPESGATRLFQGLSASERSKSCLGIEVTQALFQEVAPLVSELPLLTHVRRVNTEDKELLGQDKDGWFSVVVGNRLPVSGKKYVACLVSLEGREDILPTTHEILTQPRVATLGFTLSPEMARRVQVKKQLYDNPRDSINPPRLSTEIDEMRRIAPLAMLSTRPISTLTAITDSALFNYSFSSLRLNNKTTTSDTTEGSNNLHRIIVEGETLTRTAPPLVSVYQPPKPTVRLVCLARWTFQCTGKGDFEGLMKALPEAGGIGLMGMTAHQSTNSDTTPDSKYQVALDSGHIPLNHQARNGEQKTSFYRGPMVPVGVERNTNEGPYHSSDQARRIDPLTGLENLGYAAAFELGRLMALNDARFALELLKWRRKGHQRVSKLINGIDIKAKLGLLMPDFNPNEFLNHRMLIEQLLDRIGPRILEEGLLGPLTDPTGILDIADKMPGLDRNMVMESLNLEATQANTLMGVDSPTGPATGGLMNGGLLVDELGLATDAVLTGAFDALLANADVEFGHLDVEHNAELNGFEGI